MIGQVKTINGVKTVVPLSNEVATDSVASGNMESVTSNAVAQQVNTLNNSIQNLVKVKEVNITSSANTYITSSGGLLYKNLGSIEDFIGSGHTLLSVGICYFTQTNNYFFNVFTDSHDTTLALVTNSQNFACDIWVRFTYI